MQQKELRFCKEPYRMWQIKLKNFLQFQKEILQNVTSKEQRFHAVSEGIEILQGIWQVMHQNIERN